MIDYILQVDKSLFFLINHTRSDFLDFILPVFSLEEFHYLFFILLIVFLFGFSFYKRETKKFLFIFILLLVGYPITDFCCGKVLKKLIHRERPFAKEEGIYYYSNWKFIYQTEPQSNIETRSFPSCHSANVGFAVFFLSLNYKFTFPFLLIFLILVGYSRIYLGHHYPLDVLGGIVLGLVVSLIFYLLFKKVAKK